MNLSAIPMGLLTRGNYLSLSRANLVHYLCSVSLAIVQRYIKPILAAVLSQTQAIQASAMDILSFTVRQGLSHPMQVS